MIYGVGTDVVLIERLREMYERHGERCLGRLLADEEREDFARAPDPARFLAKRFAAKEAFGKALGIGVRAPATLTAVGVTHDALGKPRFFYSPELAAHLAELDLTAHLSLSDERDVVVAFVVMEQR